MHDPLFSCAQVAQEAYEAADRTGNDALRAFSLKMKVALIDARKKLGLPNNIEPALTRPEGSA